MEQGREQLLDTILQEAVAKAESIRQEAVAKQQEALAQAHAEMQAFLDKNAQKDEADAVDFVTKATTAATMEGKKAMLAAKRDVLATIYNRLLQRLYALPHDRYLALVEQLLTRYAQEGDCVLMARNVAIDYGEVQALPIARKLYLKVEYSDAIKGGIKLVGTSMDKDLTFEALVQSVQQSTEMDLAAQLFGN